MIRQNLGKKSGWTLRTADVAKIYPANAVAPNTGLTAGVAWTFTAYVELVAATTADFWPARASFVLGLGPVTSGTKLMVAEIELATGAAGAEVLFDRWSAGISGNINTVTAGSDVVAYCMAHDLATRKIASGTRLSFRIRINLADTLAQGIAALYVAGREDANAPSSDLAYAQDQHLRGQQTPQLLTTPTGSLLSVTSVAFGAALTWTEAIASAARDYLIMGLGLSRPSVGFSYGRYISLGIGAAGSEVAYQRLGHPGISVYGGPGIIELRRPLVLPAGSRLALAAEGGTAAVPMQVIYETM